MSMNRNKNDDFLQYLLDDEDDDEDHESDLHILIADCCAIH
jgi:hypothetical protein